MIGAFSREELEAMGFKSLGQHLRISRTATIYNPHLISIGSNVRIDNFCLIAPSGQAHFKLGDYVHLCAYTMMNGLADIEFEACTGTSPYARLLSSMDDWSGDHLMGATLPKHLIQTTSAPIVLKPAAYLGTGATVLPGVTMHEGAILGAYSMATHHLERLGVYGGVPAKYLKKRSGKCLDLIKELEVQYAP